MKTADQILKDHEDANEMHFHQVDREWIIKAMEEYAKTARPWIKCSDRLPREFQPVIVWVNNGVTLSWCAEWAEFGSFNKKRIRWHFDSTDEICFPEEITHWMPLPEPPKKNISRA